MSQIIRGADGAGTLTNITSIGGTIAVTGAAPILNVEVAAPVASWEEVTATTKTAVANMGYITNNIALVTITLPAVAPLGSEIRILGKGGGGWLVALPAGVTLIWNDTYYSVGAAGVAFSTDQYDSMNIICTTANLVWTVSSAKGNIDFA